MHDSLTLKSISPRLEEPSARVFAELGMWSRLDRQCMKVLRCRLWIQIWNKILIVPLSSYMTELGQVI